MLPSAVAARAMVNVQDILDHFAVPTELWQAFEREAGSPGDDIRLLAALPGSAIAASLTQATLPGNVPLSAIQAAHVGLAWKLARKLMHVKGGGDWDSWVEEGPWAPMTSTGKPTTSPGASTAMDEPKDAKGRILKFTQVLDQGGRRRGVRSIERRRQAGPTAEVHCIDGFTAGGGGRTYHGTIVRSSKEVNAGKTSLRLRGLRGVRTVRNESTTGFKVSYMDPHGGGLRVEGINYLVRRISHSGELASESSQLLEECTLAPLHAYELYVEKMARLYPDAWHLVYAADEMARGGPTPRFSQGYDDKKPWESVFRLVPGELKFLAGPDTRCSPYVASQRGERQSTNPTGIHCRGQPTRRCRCPDVIAGVRNFWSDFSDGFNIESKADEQRSKRSEEEKMAGSARRAPKAPGKPIRRRWRPQGRRERRKQERRRGKTGRRHLLQLEQWECTAWILASGSGMSEHDSGLTGAHRAVRQVIRDTNAQ